MKSAPLSRFFYQKQPPGPRPTLIRQLSKTPELSRDSSGKCRGTFAFASDFAVRLGLGGQIAFGHEPHDPSSGGLCPQALPRLGSLTAATHTVTFTRVRNVSVLPIFWILSIVAPDVDPRSQGKDPETPWPTTQIEGKGIIGYETRHVITRRGRRDVGIERVLAPIRGWELPSAICRSFGRPELPQLSNPCRAVPAWRVRRDAGTVCALRRMWNRSQRHGPVSLLRRRPAARWRSRRRCVSLLHVARPARLLRRQPAPDRTVSGGKGLGIRD
jgi:hypothetical protein